MPHDRRSAALHAAGLADPAALHAAWLAVCAATSEGLVMDAGTLPVVRLDSWDENRHGAIYRNEWAPSQEGEPGHWWVVSPVLDRARLGPEFTVTEHEDGTISVYPSLVFDRPGQSGFHGYLNRSVWSWGAFEDRRYDPSL